MTVDDRGDRRAELERMADVTRSLVELLVEGREPELARRFRDGLTALDAAGQLEESRAAVSALRDAVLGTGGYFILFRMRADPRTKSEASARYEQAALSLYRSSSEFLAATGGPPVFVSARFPLAIDAENDEFLGEVADELVSRFDLAPEEAVRRINAQWTERPFGPGLDWVLGHEMPEFWAKTIHYGPNVAWWTFDPQDSYDDLNPDQNNSAHTIMTAR